MEEKKDAEGVEELQKKAGERKKAAEEKRQAQELLVESEEVWNTLRPCSGPIMLSMSVGAEGANVEETNVEGETAEATNVEEKGAEEKKKDEVTMVEEPSSLPDRVS